MTETPAREHTEREDDPWAVEIPDHPGRTESAEFRHAKDTVHKILAAVRDRGTAGLITTLAGPAGIQAHHAGSLWVFSGGEWFLLLNVAGVEWSAQWSADPQKVDALRINAQRLYERFSGTLDELERLGYRQAREILNTPITDHEGVARWTDSLFNACVPLSPGLHQGVVSAGRQTGGWHHYPKSIWDMQVTKRDDFRLWVTDERDGCAAAVVPVAHRGSGDGRVQVIYAAPGSVLHAEHLGHTTAGEPHILHEDHPLARQAFAGQVATGEAA